MTEADREKQMELHSALTIERDTSARALKVAQSTIDRLEKRIAVLEAQLDEAGCELEILQLKPPAPQPIQVDPETTALLVLDLSKRCDDPRVPCHKLVPPVADFTRRARAAGVFVVFTGIHTQKWKPEGAIPEVFEACLDREPVLYPEGYSKFYGGELHQILGKHGIKTIIVTGAAANFACLYTATEAVEHLGYEVIVPSDGIVSWTQYEHDYSLYQLSVLPGGVGWHFRFTELGLISF